MAGRRQGTQRLEVANRVRRSRNAGRFQKGHAEKVDRVCIEEQVVFTCKVIFDWMTAFLLGGRIFFEPLLVFWAVCVYFLWENV